MTSLMQADILRLRDWAEAHSRWNQLRAFGDSGLVRMSILMPAFGYMLLLNDNVHQYLTIKYDGWLLRYLPSTWRIWLLFYGSFFLAAGSIGFSIFCPPEVRRYASAFEMADAETEHQIRLGQMGQEVTKVKSLYRNRAAWERSLFPFKELQDFAGMIVRNPDEQSPWLVHHWNLVNLRHPALRIAIATLFASGLTLVAIPASVTFVQVTALLLHIPI